MTLFPRFTIALLGCAAPVAAQGSHRRARRRWRVGIVVASVGLGNIAPGQGAALLTLALMKTSDPAAVARIFASQQ